MPRLEAGAIFASVRPARRATLFPCLLLAGIASCRGRPEPPAPPVLPSLPASPAYPISERGGTPATGPGDRFNHCERIWCFDHGENFFIDHFVLGHVGYVFHDPERGDIFVPRHRAGGPVFPGARQTALLFCGLHVHPWILGKIGGNPVRQTGYNRTLGYGRDHFNVYGTRLEPCCINGLGSGFVHATAGKMFNFHDLVQYRAHPEIGWQKPFRARAEIPH